MKEIKTRESIGKDNTIGSSLAYRMRKGLLKEKKTAGQYNSEDKTSESEVTNAERTADTAVNQTAHITERSASHARKTYTHSRQKQRIKTAGVEKESQIARADIITSVNPPNAGAADTAAPSFEISKARGKIKQSVTTQKRGRMLKNHNNQSKTITISDGFYHTTAPSAVADPAKRSFISKRAEEISRIKFSKTAEKSSTAIGRALTGASKAVKEGVSNLVMLLAAGGSVPMIVIILICSIGLAVGSVFGIFFASEDTGSKKTMQTVVQEINKEYRDEVDRIKAETPHDLIKLEGSSSVWRDVLSVYAVIVNTDPNNPQEVATLNAAKIDTLRDLFWKMNSITSSTETVTETVEVEISDGDGNTETVLEEKEMTLLHIKIHHRTAYEMAGEYDFDADQMLSLMELLDKKNDSMWAAVLYGIHSGATAIIEVAASQIGNEGGEPYWSWYGFSSRVEWCACFVSWCANECGYIEDGIIPKNANCNGAVRWFKEHDQWADGSAEPIPGMIIYFDWDNKGSAGDQNGTADHVGIVEKVENGWVYTIEGNSRDSVRRSQYRIGHYEILGYGIPEY